MQARQGTLLPTLHNAISLERLGRFQQSPGDTTLDMTACYFWNTALGSSLYTTMQALEVALRNSLHAAATAHFGTDMWMAPAFGVIHPQDHGQVYKAIAKVQPNLTAGRVIHSFSFGFWTTLMDRRYDRRLWHPLVKTTFPAMPNQIRTRRDLSRRFNQIRELRNRVFHHERIWDWTYNARTLPQQHQDILEALGWISPALRDTIVLFDQFPTIYAAGPAPFKAQLAAYEQTLPK
jgi:hypothetical protein